MIPATLSKSGTTWSTTSYCLEKAVTITLFAISVLGATQTLSLTSTNYSVIALSIGLISIKCLTHFFSHQEMSWHSKAVLATTLMIFVMGILPYKNLMIHKSFHLLIISSSLIALNAIGCCRLLFLKGKLHILKTHQQKNLKIVSRLPGFKKLKEMKFTIQAFEKKTMLPHLPRLHSFEASLIHKHFIKDMLPLNHIIGELMKKTEISHRVYRDRNQ